MSADLPNKKDWVSILKRNNALTLENIRRALKNCDDGERQALQSELDRLNAKHSGASSRSSSRGFGTRNQRVSIPLEHRFFVDHLPHKPYCTDDLASGLKVRPAREALAHKYLQYNNPSMVWVIVQDIDRDVDRDYFSRQKAQQPNCIVRNRVNNHVHALYFLAAGVCRTSAGRLKPLRYLAAVEGALCRQLDADPGFAGLVTKNPLHPSWETMVQHDHLWSLAELAAPLDLAAVSNEKSYRDAGLGRNVTAFDAVRLWAYSAVRDFWGPNGLNRWSAAVLGKVDEVNRQFPQPLPFAEVKAIAKSISHWTWQRFTPAGLHGLIERTHTPELQSGRGKKATNQAQIASLGGVASGRARRKASLEASESIRATARLMRVQGMSYRAIEEALGVHRATLHRWLNLSREPAYIR
ncbi:MAG: replication initiation protein [Acidithiobacillus sp.]|uniref:replication initiation protein n=1 Tax=Acidithiobacillus thiooxidans TaxID=930 RepID=UPI0009D9BBBD|nr:replication initiation protein [Acidithiobacillus thiooxidans]